MTWYDEKDFNFALILMSKEVRKWIRVLLNFWMRLKNFVLVAVIFKRKQEGIIHFTRWILNTVSSIMERKWLLWINIEKKKYTWKWMQDIKQSRHQFPLFFEGLQTIKEGQYVSYMNCSFNKALVFHSNLVVVYLYLLLAFQNIFF